MAYNTVTIQNDTSYSRNSYVTLGIPFPSGNLFSGQALVVDGATSQREYVQWYPQGARWADGSVKYARATFPVSIGANAEKDTVEVHNNSTSGGATSTFNVPIQADINDTRLEFSFLRKEYQLRRYRITGWASDGAGGTRITVSPNIREIDPLAWTDSRTEIREANLGYYLTYVSEVPVSTRFGVKLQFDGYPSGYNFGVYGANPITAKWISPSVIELPGVYDGSLDPNLQLEQYVLVGLWEPYIPANLGYILLDLNEATLVEGDGSNTSHYKRYKLFKRGSNSLTGGLPAPIWAEVVFDVYKNSDTIQFYFSWGNSYCEPVLNKIGGTYRQHTYYFEGDVRLRIYKRTTTGYTPRVSIVDSEYQLLSGPTLLNGTTTCKLLNSEHERYTTLTNGRQTQKIGRDNIPAGTTMAYKGYIVYTNNLTSTNNGDLSGTELQAIANWNGQFPPFRPLLGLPSYVTSLSNGKTRLRNMIDRFKQSYILNQPLQLSDHLVFAQKTRTTEAGGQGLIFNAIPAHWSIQLRDPYPFRLMKLAGRYEILRPIRRLTSTGQCIRYLDYVISATDWYYTSPANGLYADNASSFAGLGQNAYNTDTSPAPELQGIRGSVGLRAMDGRYSIVPDSTSQLRRLESTQSLTGYGLSHFSPDYILATAILTMDYHLLKQCEFIQLSLWSQMWSGTRVPSNDRGGIDPGSLRKVTREISRPFLAGAYLMEILGDSEFIEEMKAKVRRGESGYVGTVANQPGFFNFHISNLYGEKQYATKLYFLFQEKPDPGGLVQEWFYSPWMEFMGVVHFWGLYKILVEHGASTEATIMKKTIRDMSATVLLHAYVDTDDFSIIQFNEVDIWGPNQVPFEMPSPGDIIENVNNTSQYAEVILAGVEQHMASRLRCKIVVKNRAGGPINTGAVIRNRTTGQIFRTKAGQQYTVSDQSDGHTVGYYQTSTPRPEDIRIQDSPGFTGHFEPNYYTTMSKEVWLGTPMDYVYNPNSGEAVPYRVGKLIREYSTGMTRHGYLGGSVNNWSLGGLSIAAALANENYYDSYSSQVRATAQAAYVHNIEVQLRAYSDEYWDNNIGNNIFIENLDTNSTHVNHYASSLLLYDRLYQPRLDGAVVSGNATFSGTVISVGTSVRNPTHRLGTGVTFNPSTIRLGSIARGSASVVGQSGAFSFGGFDLDVINYGGNPLIAEYDVTIPADNLSLYTSIQQPEVTSIVYFTGGYDMAEPISVTTEIDQPGIFAYEVIPTGYVYWKRRIWASLTGATYPEFDGPPGSYGDPHNMGEDIAYGTQAEWEHDGGQYFSEDDIINVLGYPSGQTYLQPGYRSSQWTYMPYDVFIKYGRIFGYDVNPISTEITDIE